MPHDFDPGDFLIFQLESGYAILRLLDVEERTGGDVWHLAAYRDFYLDVETAESAIDGDENLRLEIQHVAITNRAFESTQVAKLKNVPLVAADLEAYQAWRSSTERPVSDRSIRLLLGLR